MSGLTRRVQRSRSEALLSGYDIRRRIVQLRGHGPAATLAQLSIEQRLFARKPTARKRNGRRARG